MCKNARYWRPDDNFLFYDIIWSWVSFFVERVARAGSVPKKIMDEDWMIKVGPYVFLFFNDRNFSGDLSM